MQARCRAARRDSPPYLFRDGKIHVGRVIEDSAAVDATDDFLLCLAGDDGSAAQLHVAATTNAVLNSNDDVLTFMFEKALVFGEIGRASCRERVSSVV